MSPALHWSLRGDAFNFLKLAATAKIISVHLNMYFQVVLNNGAGTVSSNEVNVRTLDGGKILLSFLNPNYQIYRCFLSTSVIDNISHRLLVNLCSLSAPEGFDRANVRTVNSTTIEVTWSPPRTPNGRITAYNIYA